MARLNRSQKEEAGVRLHTSLSGDLFKIDIPEISSQLLQYLEAIFPGRIGTDWNEAKFHETVGARKVIEHLRQLHAEQEQRNVPL